MNITADWISTGLGLLFFGSIILAFFMGRVQHCAQSKDAVRTMWLVSRAPELVIVRQFLAYEITMEKALDELGKLKKDKEAGNGQEL